MKRRICLLMVLILLVSITGCGVKEKAEERLIVEEVQNNKIEKTSNSEYIKEYVDPETGVHYLIYSYKAGYGGMGGMCPRYNKDGTLYTD